MDDQLPTILSLPGSLPYPLTLHNLDLKPGDQVRRGQIILRYRYASMRDETGRRKAQTEEMWATWESNVEGEVVQWEEGVRNGMVVNGPGQPIIHIQQPCSHPVTVFDMCAICGVDTTHNDYMSTPAYANNANDGSNLAGSSRSSTAPGPASASSVQITHDMPSLRVSLEEAHRLALESRTRLLKAKKLILVVDLDLTIVHAVADPTVGEWMDDIGGPQMGLVDVSARGAGNSGTGQSQEHEGALAGMSRHTKGKAKADLSSDEEALRDVYRFQLVDGPPRSVLRDVKPGFVGSASSAATASHRNWYFIKPRPGLPAFLETMSQLFEMHVYTAGSRSYADAVCRCIDPTGKYFNERILSRDESGSAASKDLRRLFPTDQSMVVVIDDRWEVWNHAPNLVKVRPFDFFAGLGDINGAFVQPRATDSPNGSTTPETPILAAGPTSNEEELDSSDLLALRQARDVENQVEARPLKRKQAEMAQEAVEDAEVHHGADGTSSSAEATDHMAPVQRRAVLKNDDTELQRLDRVLGSIHGRFFAEFAKHGGGYRVAPSVVPDPKILFDVRHIIPHLERKVFAGCVFVFSGIVSIGQRPENNEWWFLATMFGARCVHRLAPAVTHVVTAKPDTQKVYEALRMPNVKVVHKAWLIESLDLWERLPEDSFLVQRPARPELASTTPPDGPEPLPVVSDQGGGSNAPSDTEPAQEDEAEDEDQLIAFPEQPVDLGQTDFDEMDAELREFMGSDDDGDTLDSESSGGASGHSDASDTGDRLALTAPSRMQTSPAKSSLRRTHSQSSSTEGSAQTTDGEPVRKRARFDSDNGSDADNDYVGVMGRQGAEDYDEYVDEGERGQRGDMLSDGEPDDLPQERDDAGVDRDMIEHGGQ